MSYEDYCWKGVDKQLREQDAKIARLNAALSTARNDALNEAVNACEKQRLAAMNEDCKRESLGASWCREAIAALRETT